MRSGALSRRELLRLGAGAALGAGFGAGPVARAYDAWPAGPAPAVARGVPIRSRDTGLRQISLTFDDMWYEYHALRIGRAYAKRDISVTFFPTGIALLNNLERPNEGFENLYPRLRDMGHEFGTHLFTHGDFRNLTLPELIDREMNPALNTLRRALGSSFVPVAIRPPYGIVTQAMKDLSLQYDIPLVLWNLDTGDTICAANKIKSALVCCSEMLVTLRKYLVPGSIVLKHTIQSSYLAIDPTIELLKRRGLQPVSLSTMLNAVG